MEKNSLDRVKLMMGYDLSKTLNENTSEMGIKGDVKEAGLKSIETAMKSGVDLKILYAEIATALKVSEDVVKLAAAKDLTTLNKELKSAVSKDLKSGFRSGGSSLGSLTKNASKSKTIHEILNAGRPLNEKEIIAIIERNKSQAKDLIVKAEQGAKTVSTTAKTVSKDISTASKDVAAAEKEVKAAVVDVKTSAEAGKVIDQTVVAVSKKGPRLAARLRKARMTVSKYSPKFWGKLSSVKSKLSLKNLLLFGLAGYGLYELMKGWFTDGEDGGGETGGVFPPCVTNLDDYRIATTSNGDPVIVAFNPGEQTEVKFYTNGRVWTKSNDKKGRYSCKSDTVLAEQPDSVMDRRIGINNDTIQSNNNKSNDFSNISIIWDGNKEDSNVTPVVDPTPDPDPAPVKKTYKECKDFPFVFGCKNERIAEIQRCLKINDDGKFGPNTLTAITDLIYKKGEEVANSLLNKGDLSRMSDDQLKAHKEVSREASQTLVNRVKTVGIDKQGYDWIMKNCKSENKAEIKPVVTAEKPKPQVGEPLTPTNKTEPTTATAQTQTGESPADLYARLVKGGFLRGRLKGKRIVYKGPDLSKEEQEKLTKYFSQQGYRLSRDNFDKKYGDKYVFKKNEPEENK